MLLSPCYSYTAVLPIIRFSCIAVLCFTLVSCGSDTTQKSEPEQPVTQTAGWNTLDTVLSQINPPVFPDQDFLVTDYGAVGDGKQDCTEAFQQVIAACNEAGGGRVVVPEGNYRSGPIHLKSNVNLHVEKGATISFSTNPEDYLPVVFTRWEGVELMNYSPLIYAFEQENIAITGEGVFDGQANDTNWWPWKGREEYGWQEGMPHQGQESNRAALFDMAENNVPVQDRTFGEGHYLRPQFVQPYRCQNVLIQGVTFVNSPMWILNPVLCTNVTIEKVTVESQGPNSDGCDPESCKNVLIKDCFFNTGDDCIAIKSGRNADGRRINVPSENIVIQNCSMANGHGGVVIGSEISGGARNVFAENCTMNSPLLERVLRIKTSSMRGGVVENVYMRNIEVGQVAEQVIRVNMFYEDSGAYVPTVRNIAVENLTVEQGGEVGVLLEGYEQSPVTNIHLKNVVIRNTKVPYKFSNVKEILFENVSINGKEVTIEELL